MNTVVFGKTLDNVKKHKGIKFATKEARRNYLVKETNYHTTNIKIISHRKRKKRHS